MNNGMIDIVGETFKGALEAKLASKHGDMDKVDYVAIKIPMRIEIPRDAVVDIETSGYSPSRGGIVTLGIFSRNYIIIIQRISGHHSNFADFCKSYLAELMKERNEDTELGIVKIPAIERLWAYNRSFETLWLELPFEEIWPYKTKKDTCIRFDHFGFGTGADIKGWWKEAKHGRTLEGRIENFSKIVMHNFNCVVKETAIFMSQDKAFSG